jgi:hypothetical protein
MGKEDARRGRVYWLVEAFDGKRIPRLVQSTHDQGAQALANTLFSSVPKLTIPLRALYRVVSDRFRC